MIVYTNYSDAEFVYLDYEIGDVVQHKLHKRRGIVGKIYRKLNKALVELEDGSVIECFATSLSVVCDEEY